MEQEREDGYVIRVDAFADDQPAWDEMQLTAGLQTLLDKYARHPERVLLGEEAAMRLAAEVGSPFVVELINANGRRRRRFASTDAGTNELAARALQESLLQDDARDRADALVVCPATRPDRED
ncbi:hypothetical protein [Curtobacterium sp. MCBA15_001]|uniref:hypothetical protein n=1 Tax=Curtobacterium sp. MCBA15_001 TaxID=1898731 RepID=UPI0008DCABAB|nr:hypothetical protein [Curtobacterium sp. MCBA15_001]OIH96552.1 hypothetical protein BIU90_17065 [Curtobacterium sp. MCBA15_001]